MSADILLVGATGQLGWELSRQVLPIHSVTALNRTQLDITNRDQVLSAVERIAPKVVVNAAAYTAVDKAESEKREAFAVNQDGPSHFAEACGLHNAVLVHVSTDYVFDGAKDGPYTETEPTTPLGVYGKSKLAGEAAVRDNWARHIILRTSWVYGVHGNNFVKTMLRLARERDHLQIVNDQRGSPTFARDLAGVIVSMVKRIVDDRVPADGFGTFHCAGGGATTWYDFARKIFDIVDASGVKIPEIAAIATAQYPTPAPRPRNSVLDCSKLGRVYGMTLRTWESALVEMLNETMRTRGRADGALSKGI